MEPKEMEIQIRNYFFKEKSTLKLVYQYIRKKENTILKYLTQNIRKIKVKYRKR